MSQGAFSTTDQRNDTALQLAKAQAVDAIESAESLTELIYVLGVQIGILQGRKQEFVITEPIS